MNGIKVYHYAKSYAVCSIRIYRSFATIFSQMFNIAININFMLCWHYA